MQSFLIVATVASFVALSTVQCNSSYEVLYQWKTAEYNIPFYVKLNRTEYIPQNNVISIIKIFEDRMWLVTPRYLRGVPVTLSTVPYKHKFHLWERLLQLFFPNPLLQPFPSYEMNKLGDCNALQSAHGLEIDQFGRLWVVDIGRVNILEELSMQGQALNLCPAKLVIFDVNDGRSDKIFTYTFPDDVAPHKSNNLKNMQVACETKTDCWAYISDMASNRLVIYDHKNRQSWTAEHPTMGPDPTKTNFSVNGIYRTKSLIEIFSLNFILKLGVPSPVRAYGICGVGLSPRKFNFRELYFSPFGSTTLFKIRTDILKNPDLQPNGILQKNDVVELGVKSGQSDGFAMTSKGRLYYGILPSSSVVSTDTYPELNQIGNQNIVAQSNVDLLWPDAFSFDGKGTLALTTNKLYLIQKYNPTEYNFRVILLRHTGELYAYNSRKYEN